MNQNGKPDGGSRVAVVGGGMSAIAAAHYLRARGIACVIIEAADRLGGRIGCTRLGNRPVELGGKNIGRRYRLFRELAGDYGAGSFEHFGHNSSKVVGGKLRHYDSRKRLASLWFIARNLGLRDWIRFGRLAAAALRHDEEGFLGGPRFRRFAARYDGKAASGWFGRRFNETIIRPLSVRMNGAEPDEIFCGNLGTNIRMLFDDYDQLSEGMGALFGRIEREHEVRLSTRVRKLIVRDGRFEGLEMESADGSIAREPFGGMILATAAPSAAELLAEHSPSAAEELRAIRYFPLAVIIASYASDVFTSDMRGIVFDDDEALSNAAAYSPDSLNVVRYTLSGRCARALMQPTAKVEALLELAEETLGRHLPVSRAERTGFVGTVLPNGLCAYSPFHGERIDRLRSAVARLDGVHLAGDYLFGASIEACCRAGRQAAEAVACRSAPEPAAIMTEAA